VRDQEIARWGGFHPSASYGLVLAGGPGRGGRKVKEGKGARFTPRGRRDGTVGPPNRTGGWGGEVIPQRELPNTYLSQNKIGL